MSEATRPAAGAPAAAGAVTLENLVFSTSTLVYRIPKAEFRGTTLSKPELEALLSASSTMPTAARISGLAAREIVIPEVIAEVGIGGGKQVTTYKDVVLNNLAGGRIGSVVAAGGAFKSSGGPSEGEGKFGRFSLEEMDVGLAVKLTTEKAGATLDPLRKIYGAFSLEQMELKDKEGMVTRIARIAGRDFSARTMKLGWLGFVDLLGKNPKIDDAAPEDKKAIFAALGDAFDSFEFGSVEMTGLEFSGGKPGESGRIARIALTGSTGGRSAEFQLDGMDVDAADGKVKIGSIGFGGFSLRPMFAGLESIATLKPDEMGPTEIRKILPLTGRLRMSGIDFDVPGDKSADGKAERVRFSVGSLEMNAEKPVEGIPTDMRFALRNISFVVPPDSENDAAKQLKSLGYDRLDVSMTTSLGWNDGTQELELRELSLGGAEFGSATIKAVLGNVTRDIFNPDTAVATVAAMSATARSIELLVENRGLADRILNKLSKDQGRDVEDLRREFGAMAMLGIPMQLGNSPAAKAVGQTVARFVAKPGRLLIRARAKAPAGFGVADFAAGPDPVAIMDQLEITSSAE